MTGRTPMLYAIVTGAPPAKDVGTVVRLAAADGWRTGVIASPAGRKFLDVPTLCEQTGYPVVSEYRQPGDLEPLPRTDAILVAPATGNTVAKLAAGISDTLATGLCVEAIGAGVPLVVVPFTNWAHLAHPALAAAVATLRDWGVQVLLGDDVYRLHDPGPSARFAPLFPWRQAWDAVKSGLHAADGVAVPASLPSLDGGNRGRDVRHRKEQE